MTNLTVSYESNRIYEGSKSPFYRVIKGGNQWGLWNALSASIPVSAIQPIVEPGGILALYALGGNGCVYRLSQFHPSATPIAWNGWYGASTPPPLAQMQVLIVNNQLAIIGLGLDRKAYFTYSASGVWAAWTQIGGASPELISISAAATTDNRLAVFGVLYDQAPGNRKVKHIEQSAANFMQWGNWSELGTSPTVKQVQAIATFDGRLAVFAVDNSNLVQYIQQTQASSPSATWGAWGALGTSPAVTQIALLTTPAHWLAVFAIDSTSHVQCIQQTQASSPSAAWGAWTVVGTTTPEVAAIAPSVTPDNYLLVCAVDSAQRIALAVQTTAATPSAMWGDWTAIAGSPSLSSLTSIVQGTTIELFGQGWSVPVTPEQLSRVNRKTAVKYFNVIS